jgi:hypothetical protein
VLETGQITYVKIIEMDLEKKRVSLSVKDAEAGSPALETEAAQSQAESDRSQAEAAQGDVIEDISLDFADGSAEVPAAMKTWTLAEDPDPVSTAKTAASTAIQDLLDSLSDPSGKIGGAVAKPTDVSASDETDKETIAGE